MITKIEVKHNNVNKMFDPSELEKAKVHAQALEKLGYNVSINLLTMGIYNTQKIIIYQSEVKYGRN